MSTFEYEKKLLIEKVFEKAKNESLKTAKTSVAKYLEIYFLEDLKFNLSYKSFERYHDFFILEKNLAYPIDKERLDVLSLYLGYQDFSEFYSNFSKEEESESTFHSNVEKQIQERDKIILKRRKKMSPYLFISVIIFGLMLFLVFNTSKISGESKTENKVYVQETKEGSNQTKGPAKPLQIAETDQTSSAFKERRSPQSQFITQIIIKKEKDCMVWNEDHFVKVFCDEKFPGSLTEGFDDYKFLMRKIKTPDTLNAENAIGKVWYDKTNKKVEFFTQYGIHPENGKTLKPVTKHILETYCNHKQSPFE